MENTFPIAMRTSRALILASLACAIGGATAYSIVRSANLQPASLVSLGDSSSPGEEDSRPLLEEPLDELKANLEGGRETEQTNDPRIPVATEVSPINLTMQGQVKAVTKIFATPDPEDSDSIRVCCETRDAQDFEGDLNALFDGTAQFNGVEYEINGYHVPARGELSTFAVSREPTIPLSTQELFDNSHAHRTFRMRRLDVGSNVFPACASPFRSELLTESR